MSLHARTFTLSQEAAKQLEALRSRTEHLEARSCLEWCVRAMSEHHARIDRENASDLEAKVRSPKMWAPKGKR